MKKVSLLKLMISAALGFALLCTGGLLSSFVSADTDYKTKYGITYEELFMQYPSYLDNDKSAESILNARNEYMSAIAGYDQNGAFAAAEEASSSSAMQTAITSAGSALGLSGSYYNTAMDKASLEMLKRIYFTADSVNETKAVKRAALNIAWINGVNGVTGDDISLIAENMRNLSSSQVSTVLNAVTANAAAANISASDKELGAYAAAVCLINDTELEMLDEFAARFDGSTLIRTGVNQLRSTINSEIETYTLKRFITDRKLSNIISVYGQYGEWNKDCGYAVLGGIISQYSAWMIYDEMFSTDTADASITEMMYAAYAAEAGAIVSAKREAINSPFFGSVVETYEYMYELRSLIMALALDSIGSSSADSVPSYTSYIEACLQTYKDTAAEDRVRRLVTESDKLSVSSGTVIAGAPDDGDEYTDTLLLDSAGSPQWTVTVSGGTLWVKGEMSVPQITVSSGTLKVSGILDIEYDLTVPNRRDAVVEMAGGTLNIGENYSNEGALKMTNDSDHIVVNGNYSITGSSSNYYKNYNTLTAGTLEVKGDITCGGGYNPSGTHKTVLSGTAAQTVNMAVYNTGCFNALDIMNASDEGITVTASVDVYKELYSNGCNITNAAYLYLNGDAKPRGNVWNYDITLNSWNGDEAVEFNGNIHTRGTTNIETPQKFNGNLFVDNGTTNFNVNQTVNGNVTIASSTTLNLNCSDVNINGNVTQSSSSSAVLNLNGTRVNIGENYSNEGALKMTNDSDHIVVNGNYSITGSSSNYYKNYNTLTAGTLEVKGDITCGGGYNPSGTHKTVLSGTMAQTVNMAVYNTGCFNTLEILNTSEDGITVTAAVDVKSEIRQPAGTLINNASKLSLQSKTAFVDYGSENELINSYMGNASGVTPTWLDYETYCARDTSNTGVLSVTVKGTAASVSGDSAFEALVPYGSGVVAAADILVKTSDEAAAYEIKKNGSGWNIVVTAADGAASKTYSLTVTEDVLRPISGIYMSKTKALLNIGETLVLEVTFVPANSTYQTVAWSSSDEAVAKVVDGTVTAIGSGTAYITAVSGNGYETTCAVTVEKPSEGIRLNRSEAVIAKGGSVQLSALLTPAASTDNVVWSTSNRSVAKVSSGGLVSGIANGTAVITAETSSGFSAACQITVQDFAFAVSGVAIDENEIILSPDDAKRLSASVTPSNAVNSKLTWESSDESICVVSSDGVVTAIAAGTAFVTASSANGYFDKCIVRVVTASDTSVILSDEAVSPGENVTVSADIVKNPGISAYLFTISYDPTILTPVSVAANPAFGGTLSDSIESSESGEFNVLWYANEDRSENGALFAIEFETDYYAEYGTETEVRIEYSGTDICNTAGENIAVYTENSTVTIADPGIGDIYEDGEVNVYDLTLASRYVTGIETLTSRQLNAADVNDDGTASIKDVVAIAKSLTESCALMSAESYDEADNSAVVRISNAAVGEDGTAALDVSIDGNPGIAGFVFHIDYDTDNWEIVEIEPNTELLGDTLQSNLGSSDRLRVTWYNSSDIQDNGVIFTLKARYIGNEAEAAGAFSIGEYEITNSELSSIETQSSTGWALTDNCVITSSDTEGSLTAKIICTPDISGNNAEVIAAFYDANGVLTECLTSKTELFEGVSEMEFTPQRQYSSCKCFVWDSLNGMKPF